MGRNWSFCAYNEKDKNIEPFPYKYVEELVSDLRPQDREDLEAACGIAEVAIWHSIEMSEIVIIIKDDAGKCMSLLGLGSRDNCTLGRYIWSVSTNEIEKGYVRPVLINFAREVIGDWANRYELLQNLVYAKNTKSIRYMEKILGAKFLRESLTIDGKEWKQFYILGKEGK